MAANRLRSEAEVTSVDGQTYVLRFGTNACIEIEDALEVTDLRAFLGSLMKRSRREYRTLVRLLLKHHHSDIDSDEKAGDLIDAFDPEQLAEAIVCAFNGMTPEQLRELAKKNKGKGKSEEEKPRPEAAAAAGQQTS